MKWYNFETSFTSLKKELVQYLKQNEIKYELSDASVPGCLVYHFEIYTDVIGAMSIDVFLDSVTIKEQ